MPSPLPLLRFLVLWLPALVQAHTLQLESCHTDRIILQPWLQVHEDDRGDYTLDDLLDVVSTESGAVDLSHLRPGLASAALWLRFEVVNAASEDCRMWLFPAAPRARPLAQWDAPLRLPAFELYLPSGQSRVFILRMGNWPPVGMQPMLLSHDGLLRTRATLWPLVPLSLLSSKEFAMPMPFIAEPQSHFYHSRGLRLHYLDWGNPDAPTLILIHGGLEHVRQGYRCGRL